MMILQNYESIIFFNIAKFSVCYKNMGSINACYTPSEHSIPTLYMELQ